MRPIAPVVDRVRAALSGRSRSVASVGFVSISTLGLIVAMFLADGFRATSYDLQDASVWVTSSEKSSIGRINMQIARQDEKLRLAVDTASTGDLDIVQDGRSVLVVHPAAGTMTPIDVVGIGTGSDLEIPPGSQVSMAGGTVAVSLDGDVWAAPIDTFAGVAGGEGGDPTVQLGAGGLAVVGTTGLVAGFAPAAEGPELRVVDLAEQATRVVPLRGGSIGAAQLTLVGDLPVLLDEASNRLHIDDEAPVALPDAESWKLQLPGDDPSQVVLASAEGLLSVPVGGGEPRWLSGSDDVAGGEPTDPVRVGRCTYGAWASPAAMHVLCDGQEPIARELAALAGAANPNAARAEGVMRFRVNQTRVALNFVETGATFLVDADLTMQQADDWGSETTSTTSTTVDPDDSAVIELKEEQEPPKPRADEFGARPGRQTLLGVLDNDTDANGDPLTVEAITPDDFDGGTTVSIVQGGQAVQVTPGPDTAGSTIRFEYTVSDGQAEATAAVVVTVRKPDENGAPQLKLDPEGQPRVPEIELALGSEASYDVLQDWIDPDGDPILLTNALLRTPSSNDQVIASPSGRLDFNDGNVLAGLKPVDVTVSDTFDPPAATAGVLKVTVRGETQDFPPIARPDFVSTAVDTTAIIQPLLNDTPGSGDELRLTAIRIDDLGAGATAVHNRHDDTVSFQADKPGDYRFTYQIADGGTQEVEGAVRVKVVHEDANTPPAAAPDLVVVPLGGVATVDLLANDYDADGDVLGVQSLDTPQDMGLRASLVEFRRIRVELNRTIRGPVVLGYRLSDGVNPSTQGQVVIVQAPEGAGNEAPRPADDAVTVIAGDITSIPVLANDIDPEGDPLTLGTQLIDPPQGGGALAVVSGPVVKFRAPATAGRVRFSYEVSDPGGRTATGRVTVDVREPSEDNLGPRGRTVEARVLQGGRVTITVPLVGIDPDGDSVTVEGLEDAPEMGLVTTPTGPDHLVYTAFTDAEGGTDVFRYRLRDRRGMVGFGTVRVAVLPRTEPNRSPEAFDDVVQVRPGGTVLVPVLANDLDPDGDRVRLAADRPPQAQGGVVAEITGTRLRITVPGDGPYPGVKYHVSDRKGGYGSAFVDVQVTPDAAPLPPIARDDVDVRPVGAAEVQRSVSVTDNDDDPDGDPSRLDVSLVAPAPEWASVVDNDERDEVVVRLGDRPRVVAYKVVDVDSLEAVGFVRVPARGEDVNQPPSQRGSDRLPVQVAPGATVKIAVGDFVGDSDGPEALRLTDVARVTATRADPATDLVVDPQTVQFRPRDGFDGEASITFEVTDGVDPVVVSLPIAVEEPGDQAPEPTGQPVVVEVAPGEEPVQVDLSQYFRDPEAQELTFGGLSGGPPGTTSSIRGAGLLVVEAADDAPPGVRTEVTFDVSDGAHTIAGSAQVRVVPSRRELARTGDDSVVVDVGDSLLVPVLANDNDPFIDGGLTITHIDPGAFGGARIDGDHISITPLKGSEGSWTVTYTVEDRLGDPERAVQGRLTVQVRDVPDQPSPPPKVEEVQSKRVVLSWQQPAPNGSDIEAYTVRWNGGRSSQTCPSTTCEITGLSNNTVYNFTVSATNEVGESAPSAPSGPAKPDQRPDRPAAPELEFRPDTDGTLFVTWGEVVPDGTPVEEYRLRLTPAPRSGSSERSVGTALSYEWSGLENGTEYTVELLARNEVDWSEPSPPSDPEVPSRIADVPGQPVADRVVNRLGGQMRITWAAVVRPADGGAQIESYTVRTYRSGSASPDPSVAPIQVTDGTEALVRDIQRDVDYEFTVTATNRSGTTAESPRSVASRAYGVPDDVTGVTASNGNGSAALTIAAPADGGRAIERYEVRTLNAGDRSQVKTDTFAASATTTVGGLANGTRYVFEARACNDVGNAVTENGCGGWSPPSNEARPLGPLANPSIGFSGSTTITFSWSLPADPGRALAAVEVRISDGTVLHPPLTWGSSGNRAVNFGYERDFSATITVRDEAGRTTTASTSGRTADYPRGGSASWGSATSVSGCGSGCRRMTLNLSGWPPGAGLAVTCESNPGAGWRTDFGYDPPDLTADGAGNASSGDNSRNCVGQPANSWGYRFRVQHGAQVRYFQLP